MKRMLIALMMVALVAGSVAGGVMAAWSDEETSAGNTFQAGYLDLALSNGGPWDETWSGPIASVSNLAPGQEVGPFCMWFQNQGSIDGIVTVNMSYLEADSAESGEFVGMEVDQETFASRLIVTWAQVDGAGINVAPFWAKQVIDDAYGGVPATAVTANAVVADGGGPTGYLPTMYGLKSITLHFWYDGYKGHDEVFSRNESHHDCFKLKLDAGVGNDFMFDGIDITIKATLTQISVP